MKCINCGKEFHYCLSCGYVPELEAGFCSFKCVEEYPSKSTKTELIKLMVELLYSENNIVFNEYKSYLEQYKSEIGEALINYIYENM